MMQHKLPEELVYFIFTLLDRKSFLQFAVTDTSLYRIGSDPNLRNIVSVFPYKANIPYKMGALMFPCMDPNNIPVGYISCIEKPGDTLISQDLPFVVVYNSPSSSNLGVIFPCVSYTSIDIETIRFGPCRIETGTYLHREHFRLARSSKRLISTMREDIESCLNNFDLKPVDQMTENLYYVSKIAKYDLKSSARTFEQIQKNLQSALTLSDSIGMNPAFRHSKL